jgi:hypothetical protein
VERRDEHAVGAVVRLDLHVGVPMGSARARVSASLAAAQRQVLRGKDALIMHWSGCLATDMCIFG